MKYETTPNKIRDGYKKSSDNKIKLDKKETSKKTVKYKDKNINGTIVKLYDSGYEQVAASAIANMIDVFSDFKDDIQINTLLDYYQTTTEFVDF
jgi:hypothetical protein